MTPNAEYRPAAQATIKNLRPSNPRLPVRVDIDGGRGHVVVPPGSSWAHDATGKLLWVKLSSGLLRCYTSTPDGGSKEIPVPSRAEVEAYKAYFPD